jgi:hypothetical protein
MYDKPFTSRVQHLFKFRTYEQMAEESAGTRSASWWRHVQLEQTDRYNPPPPKDVPGIAKLFGATAEQVSAMTLQLEISRPAAVRRPADEAEGVPSAG